MRTLGVVMAMVALIGCDYAKKSKKSEAEANLEKLGDAAKKAFAESKAFPKGSMGLTPSEPCCASMPDHKCKPVPADWSKPVWQALSFGPDEPHYFQYSYTSDGATFTATAVGDLDCDMTTVTWQLEGRIADGDVALTLTKPSNSD